MRNFHPGEQATFGAAIAAKPGPLRNPAARALLAVWLVFTLLATVAGPAVGEINRGGEIRSGEIDPGVIDTGAGNTVVVGSRGLPTGPSRGESPPLRSDTDESVELELVAGVQSLADVGPPVVLPAETQQHQPGDHLSGNEFGCDSTCITEALLIKSPLHPNIELSMTTNVSTTKKLWVLPPGPYMVNGFPAHYGVIPTAEAGSGYSWNHDIVGLAHDSSYRIVILAIDTQGNPEMATTIVATSPAPPQNLVGNGSGCYYDCIEAGTVTPGASFDVATIELSANTEVDFDVFVSTQAPTEVDGNPVLANQINLNITNETPTSLVGQLTGLAGDTTYHVVGKATDVDGFVHYAVGSFHTEDEPVVVPESNDITVGFEKVHVVNNGDLVGFGEITFRTGIGPDGANAYWQSGQYKLADGDTKVLEYETTIEVAGGEALPQLIVNVLEEDTQLFAEPNTCGVGQTLFVDPITPACAGGGLTIAAGMVGGITAEWIDTLLTCDNYGVPAFKANRKCMLILSHGMTNDDYVDFEALVSFDVN